MLGALQAVILLGYLLLRRRSGFTQTAVELILLVSLALGLFEVPGGAHHLGLGVWGPVTWALAIPAAVAFTHEILGLRLDRLGRLLAWMAVPAVLFSLLGPALLDACSSGEGCPSLWRAQSAWSVIMAFAGLWLVGHRMAATAAVLLQRPLGEARFFAAGALAGIMAVRGLAELAYLGSHDFAADAARFAALGYFIGLTLVLLALIRLYPETAETALNVNDHESVDRFRRHLAHAVVFEEGGVNPLARASVLTTILTVLALIGWSAVTPVKEVAATSGQVVPSSQIRPIQHLEGGIVADVLVREGQMVEKGEVLLRLDPAQAMAELDQIKVREAGLELRAERLRAFAEGRGPDFSHSTGGSSDAAQISDQNTIFRAQEASRTSGVAVLDNQIAQRRSEISQYEGQYAALGHQLDLVGREVGIREDLLAKGLNSQVSYLTVKREFERLKGERGRLGDQLRTSREALAEALSRVQDQRSKLAQDALTEMGVANAELAQLRETRGKLEDRVQRLALVAPVRGIVQELTVSSPGVVIPQGGLVTKIVPVDDTLMVENQIQPRDVGHVRPGQPVRVKVSSYDFARFGAVDGVLTQISPSTFLDEDKLPYYKGVVTLAKSYVGDDPERNRILPGMTVQADVVTGEKTILQYLLKPIQLAAAQSFRER